MSKPRIESIRIVREVDDSPDLSWLGEYGETWKDGALDRKKENGYTLDRREYPYFYPNLGNYAGLSKRTQRKYILQDYSRMEAYNHGGWCMVGIHAEATVSYLMDEDQGISRLQSLSSGGLWGIESDSDDGYFHEVAEDELSDLKAHLETLGVDTSDFDEKAAEAKEAYR